MTYEQKNIDHVKLYYGYVDANKIEELVDLFSDDILYIRCEHEIKGKEDLKKFYNEERGIEGKHTLEEILSGKDKVVAKGIFSGKNRKGENITLPFMDFFYLDDSGKIKERYTYLATGYNLTK